MGEVQKKSNAGSLVNYFIESSIHGFSSRNRLISCRTPGEIVLRLVRRVLFVVVVDVNVVH